MLAATQARARMLSDNARKKAQINELKAFVARFSANASKARQATSRSRQIDKIQLEEVKASSRVNPYIRFEQDKKLHRQALIIEHLEQGYGDEAALFSDLNLMLEVGQRIAIIGPNGIGKTTLLETLIGKLAPRKGKIKWSENSEIGYYAQDHAGELDWLLRTGSRRRI
jgi:ATPase subunit of ABC transporter with duplicated ATPase domains